jgi:hypothetical protein
MSKPETPKPQKSGAERRRWPRAGIELPVTIVLDGMHHEAKVRDISRAGVSFYLERPIPLMTVLGLSLDLHFGSRKHPIRGQGAVVRCERISPSLQQYEIALFLHDLSESDREAIDNHVKARLALA